MNAVTVAAWILFASVIGYEDAGICVTSVPVGDLIDEPGLIEAPA